MYCVTSHESCHTRIDIFILEYTLLQKNFYNVIKQHTCAYMLLTCHLMSLVAELKKKDKLKRPSIKSLFGNPIFP